MRLKLYVESVRGEADIKLLFNKAVKSKDLDIQLRTLKKVWPLYNKKYFNGKMKTPVIAFTKDTGLNFNRRGVYLPGRNILRFSRRVFLTTFDKFREIFLHEMCHQAVDLLDHIRDIHGPTWKKRMISVGLNPSRLDYDSNESYMNDAEKEKYKEMKKKAHEKVVSMEKAKEDASKKNKRLYYIKNNTPAKYFDPGKNSWHEGLIVCANDKQEKRWCFIKYPESRSWLIIPSDWFYELNDPEKEKRYRDSDYLLAAEKVRENIQFKKNIKLWKSMV